MKIRQAVNKDIPRIMEIINDAKEFLKSQGIDQWQDGYPNEQVIENDILQNEFYVMEDEEVVGCMALSFRGEDAYDVIEGQWLSKGKFGVIHRIAVDNKLKGKRLANQFLQFSEKVALELNINSIKIDTHPKNLSMQKWIKNNGFTECGTVYMRDNALRIAYEKILN